MSEEHIRRKSVTVRLNRWKNQIVETYGENDEYVKCLNDVVNIVDGIPAADVVEVVRCGECMFWDAPPSCEGLARCRTGESGVRFRKAYDFCSRAQKDGRRC